MSDGTTISVHPDIARVTDTAGGLARIAAARNVRIAARPLVGDLQTLPDGRVVDHVGRVVYNPTPPKGG